MMIVIGCVLQHYKAGEFPSSIVDFLKEVKDYLKFKLYRYPTIMGMTK